jgi:hypothetical protein
MEKMRIPPAVIVVLAAGTLLFSGCEKKTVKTINLSTVRILGVNKEYTVAGKNIKLSDWYTETIPSRLWEHFIKDLAERGIKPELDLVMTGRMKTAFQTILASGKLNDYDMVSLGWGDSDEAFMHSLYRQNRLLPLNRAIEQYSTGPARDYYTSHESGKFFKKLQTLEDGNFYWITGTQETYFKDPGYSTGSHTAGMIRWDWLQALGLEIPASLEEFYNALLSFQQNDMNKNGIRDETAQISTEDFNTGVAQWFGLGDQLVSAIDYRAISPWYQPHVREYITYLNRLYTAGLIRADDESGAMQANRIGYERSWILETWNEPGIDVPQDAAKPCFVPFIIQAAADNPARIWLQSGRVVSWTPAFIPAGAKNAEGAVRIIDYQVSKDYAILSEAGIENYSFRYDSGGNIVKGEPRSANVGMDINLIRSALPALWTNGSIIPRHVITDTNYEVLSVLAMGYKLKADFALSLYNKTYPFIMDRESYLAFPTAEELERISAITPGLNTYSSALLTSLITGEKTLDGWDSYLANLKRLGLDELIGIYQARLDRAR